ncbi:hypothetical protein ON010_g6709 [Phytophthora cinnamomi]|nr:hypothetical protein ON010_g6709 [Phytophthora cinnamomi]
MTTTYVDRGVELDAGDPEQGGEQRAYSPGEDVIPLQVLLEVREGVRGALVQIEGHAEEPALGREDAELRERGECATAQRVRVDVPAVLEAQREEQVDDGLPVDERVRVAPPLALQQEGQHDDGAADDRDEGARLGRQRVGPRIGQHVIPVGLHARAGRPVLRYWSLASGWAGGALVAGSWWGLELWRRSGVRVLGGADETKSLCGDRGERWYPVPPLCWLASEKGQGSGGFTCVEVSMWTSGGAVPVASAPVSSGYDTREGTPAIANATRTWPDPGLRHTVLLRRRRAARALGYASPSSVKPGSAARRYLCANARSSAQ